MIVHYHLENVTQLQENVRYVLSMKTVIRKTPIGANYQDTKDVSTAKELEMKIMTMCVKKVSKELILLYLCFLFNLIILLY